MIYKPGFCMFWLIALIYTCKSGGTYTRDEVQAIAVHAASVVDNKLKVGVLGAPLDQGQTKNGVVDGPAFCRQTGFIPILEKTQYIDIVDDGDLSFGPTPNRIVSKCDGKCFAKNVKAVGNANKLIFKKVKEIIEGGRISLTLGGDHSISIGTIAATSEKYNGDVAVLWVDAHGDINTPSTSPSGNIHGMPLGFLVKELQWNVTKFISFAWLKSRISACNLAYIGTRDLDPPEKVIIKELNITVFTMDDIRKVGIKKVTQMALDKISPGRKRPLHLSFDIDVMDPTEVSTTGTPAPEGLTAQEGNILMTEVFLAGNLVAMDFTEVNPQIGNPNEKAKTSKIVKNLILHAFGKKL